MADRRVAQRPRRATDYWLSNLPIDTEPERLARLARLRWMIELDYKQLKGELGLDHYEGRSYLGSQHHCTLVTAAHGFLTKSGPTQITSGRPDTAPDGAATRVRRRDLLRAAVERLAVGGECRSRVSGGRETRALPPRGG